jgi:hypothetical protein
MALPGDPRLPQFDPSGEDDPLLPPSTPPRVQPRPRSTAPAPQPAPPAAVPPPETIPPASGPITDPPFVRKPYVRPAPSPIDPLIEALPESVQEGIDTASDVVEGAAGETLAYAQQNKRKTAYIALGLLVVGLILTSINRRKRRIKVGETDLF